MQEYLTKNIISQKVNFVFRLKYLLLLLGEAGGGLLI